MTTPPAARCLILSACLLLGACASDPATREAGATATSGASDPTSVKPGINDSFLSPDLDVQSYVDRFEVESREIAAQRGGIVAALRIEPGMDVADVGAGTGLFLEPLARAVGAEGTVHAVDISPRFVEHLDARIADAGLAQVRTVLCTGRSAELPEASVDLVFVCDTYHHFEHPLDTLASLHAALRPGGKLVVVDFERIEGVTREWLLDHVRAGKDVFRGEIEAAGFRFVREVDVEGLSENYVLVFRRD